MTAVLVLALLAAWCLLSVLTAAACAAILRGGVEEDRARGFLTDSC